MENLIPDVMKKLLLILLFHFTVNTLIAGGGWSTPKGKGYFKLGQNMIIADRFFNPDGEVIDITTISLYTTSLYGEYGLGNNLTGIVYAPFFVRSTINEIEFRQSGNVIPGDEVNDIGDINIGIKYGFFQDKSIVMAASLVLGLPTGNDSGGEGGILQTGDGEFNQLIKLEASHSFYPIPLYVTLFAGFNNRTNNFSDEYHLGLEVGYTLNRISFNCKVNSVQSLFNGESDGSAGNGVFSNNTEYVSYTPEVNWNITEKLGISANAGFALSGKRILASPNYGLGIYYQL